MVRPDRLAALFLDALFVLIFCPFVLMWILTGVELDANANAGIVTLFALFAIVGEAACRASVGIFLTGQTIVPVYGNARHKARYFVRSALKYFPFLLAWPTVVVGSDDGRVLALIIASYPVLVIMTSAISIAMYGDSVFDRIAGLTVVSLTPRSDHVPRGFEPITPECVLRAERVDEEPSGRS